MNANTLVTSEEPGHEPERVRRRLAEAIAWCDPRARLDDPRGSLRQINGASRDYDALAARPGALVSGLCSARAERVSPDGATQARIGDGRLLIYLPDENLFDGAAEEETRGFFDVDNIPPWDTWVAFTENGRDPGTREWSLISYVPPVFVPLVKRGIYVNPEACILWAENDRLETIGLSQLT